MKRIDRLNLSASKEKQKSASRYKPEEINENDRSIECERTKYSLETTQTHQSKNQREANIQYDEKVTLH